MRIGSGIVTSAAPVSQVAWIVVISRRVVGPISATWSPGRTPRACRPAAAARASRWSSSHPIVTVSSPLAKVMRPLGSAATDSIRSISDSTLF